MSRGEGLVGGEPPEELRWLSNGAVAAARAARAAQGRGRRHCGHPLRAGRRHVQGRAVGPRREHPCVCTCSTRAEDVPSRITPSHDRRCAGTPTRPRGSPATKRSRPKWPADARPALNPDASGSDRHAAAGQHAGGAVAEGGQVAAEVGGDGGPAGGKEARGVALQVGPDFRIVPPRAFRRPSDHLPGRFHAPCLALCPVQLTRRGTVDEARRGPAEIRTS